MKSDINKLLYFCGVIFSLSFFICCNSRYNGHIGVNQTEKAYPIRSRSITKMPWDNNKISLKDKRKNNTNVLKAAYQNVLPIRSRPITKMPWDNNKNFLRDKRKNNTNVLMAAYKTVLLDPLPGEEYNVNLCARLLCGTIVKSGSIFSQNKILGPYTISKGYRKGPTYIGEKLIKTTGGGVCKVATTLYNVAVLCNLPIIKRHYHSMPVSYVPYGQDATVSYGSRDFKFKNSKSSPILIWSQCIGNTLYIGFYGRQPSPKVEWHHKVLSVKKTKTIYKKNLKLRAGTKKVIVHGMDGKIVKSWVKIYYPNGKVQLKQMGISRYRPLPYIIQIGS